MCKNCNNPTAKIVKKGTFRKKNTRRVQRYQCQSCRKSFSDQTGRDTYRLRKVHLRNKLFRILCSGVSQRRAAQYFGVHRDTVALHMMRMVVSARKINRIKRIDRRPAVVVFDEMETYEHTKCKPVSIAVAVEEGSRFILSLVAAQMPAKGHLADISRKKYGPRADHRPRAIVETFTDLMLNPDLTDLKTDQSPRYPGYVKRLLPGVKHHAFKGRRGCVVGQGELKRGGFDPLFALNHTCAEIRDSVKRLSRRTWCTYMVPPTLQEEIVQKAS